MRRVVALLIILFALTGGAVYAAHVMTLDAGDSVAIRCTADALQITQDNPVSALAICSANATATATPAPADTATPEPTATATHDHGMDEADLRWHAPGAHGDRPAHEHGDAPPQWVIDAGITPMFTHDASTPGENMAYYKHTAFKGWTGRFNNQDWYGVFHLDSNPAGQRGRFHSYQLWIKADDGSISHFHGWLDFGTGNNAGAQRVVTCGQDSQIRPIILANQAGCAPRFENWYAAPAMGGRADWAPDFGFNINPQYFASDSDNPADWTPTGGVRNLDRRIEFAWYANRSALRGEFWTTQFGDLVSGLDDAICGTQRSYGDRTYVLACINQYISPALRTIQFPGNAVQRAFPGNGVQLPN